MPITPAQRDIKEMLRKILRRTRRIERLIKAGTYVPPDPPPEPAPEPAPEPEPEPAPATSVTFLQGEDASGEGTVASWTSVFQAVTDLTVITDIADLPVGTEVLIYSGHTADYAGFSVDDAATYNIIDLGSYALARGHAAGAVTQFDWTDSITLGTGPVALTSAAIVYTRNAQIGTTYGTTIQGHPAIWTEENAGATRTAAMFPAQRGIANDAAYQSLASFLLSLVVGNVVVPTPEPAPEPEPEPDPLPPPGGVFSVEADGSILDPDGVAFVPVGANVGFTHTDSAGAPVWHAALGGQFVNGHLADIQAWGWNILRANANTSPFTQVGATVDYTSGIQGLLDLIAEVTPHGIVVLVDAHPAFSPYAAGENFLGSNPAWDGPDMDNVRAFWDLVIPQVEGNPYVWVNFINEPFGVRPHTEPGYAANETYIRTFNENAYNYLRTTLGYTGIITMPFGVWCQDIQYFTGVAGGHDGSSARTWFSQFEDTILDWHAYGALLDPNLNWWEVTAPEDLAAAYTTILSAISTYNLPVLVGEYGYDWDSVRRGSTWGGWLQEQAAAALNTSVAFPAGIGMIYWHANGDSGVYMHYSLKNGDQTFWQPTNSGNLSEGGALHWGLTH